MAKEEEEQVEERKADFSISRKKFARGSWKHASFWWAGERGRGGNNRDECAEMKDDKFYKSPYSFHSNGIRFSFSSCLHLLLSNCNVEEEEEKNRW